MPALVVHRANTRTHVVQMLANFAQRVITLLSPPWKCATAARQAALPLGRVIRTATTARLASGLLPLRSRARTARRVPIPFLGGQCASFATRGGTVRWMVQSNVLSVLRGRTVHQKEVLLIVLAARKGSLSTRQSPPFAACARPANLRVPLGAPPVNHATLGTFARGAPLAATSGIVLTQQTRARKKCIAQLERGPER